MEDERECAVAVRLRLSFEDKKMLQKSQRKLGLKRSWFSLKSWHTTISDVAVHLLDAFQLQDSCPNGLILSMDGFVLPPFESTSILKDKDIISVKRKGKCLALIKPDGEFNSSEKLGIVKKGTVNTGLKLLANEEFQKETGGYKSASEDNEPDNDKLKNTLHGCNGSPYPKASKKRKASKELKKPKKKKNKHTFMEEGLAPPVDKDGVHEKENGITNDDKNIAAKEKNLHNNIVSSDLHHELEKSSNSGTEEDSDTPSDASPSLKRPSITKEKLKSAEDASHTPDGTKKGPSRSARRKKAKRQWLREMAKISKIEPHQRQSFTTSQLSSGKEASRAPEECQRQVRKSFLSKKESHQLQMHKENSNQLPSRYNVKVPGQVQQPDHVGNEDDDIVPVVICPGHIRFESRENGKPTDQNRSLAENFEWNGTTSKKKGLKWGTEKAAYPKRVECTNLNQGMSNEPKNEQSTNTKSDIDFNKLPPCASLPKEGDVIAYRLIELSSTWTPELSSYRVGQVTKFHTGTNHIVLKPVPEFPIDFETKVDEEGNPVQPDMSLYGNDGSLEVGFSSLIEVRIVKFGHANAEALTDAANRPPLENQSTALERGNMWEDKGGSSSTWGGQTVCNKEAHAEVNGWEERDQASSPEGNVDAWEEISRSLNAKKSELSQKGNWSKKEDSGKRSWSHRGLRGSALGPTMALLRAQNQL